MYFWISIVATFLVAFMIGNKNLVNKFWNYLLLFLLIVDAWYIGNILINNLPIFINAMFRYLQSMTSSLDAVILVALITGTISLLNSFYSRYSDNRNKRREYLAAKREEPYAEFINLVFKITQRKNNGLKYTDKEMAKDIQSFNSKITLWGSPKVVNKWIKFRKISLDGENKISPEKNLILIEEVMNEMRKDLGVKQVDKGNLLSIFINDVEQILKK